MRNCFFEDDDFSTIVRPLSFLKKDDYGIFTDVKINKTDVVNFVMLGMMPYFDKDSNTFSISVALTNATEIRINGIRAATLNLDDIRLQEIPVSLISIRELALKRYSKKTKHKKRQCYATRAIFHVSIPKTKITLGG